MEGKVSGMAVRYRVVVRCRLGSVCVVHVNEQVNELR